MTPLGFLWPFDETGGGDDVTTIAPLFRYSNYAEAVLWIAIGAFVIVRARRRRGSVPRLHRVLAVALLVFGVSDLVEANTGAWWRPWWLLVWKGACLLVFLMLLIQYAREKRVTITPDTAARSRSSPMTEASPDQSRDHLTPG